MNAKKGVRVGREVVRQSTQQHAVKGRWLYYPIPNLGAVLYVQGLLMRRNVLAYPTPPGHKGVDLIAVHPTEPGHGDIRLQVKSRLATDANYSIPMAKAELRQFDYLVLVRQNLGYRKARGNSGAQSDGVRRPVVYAVPVAVAEAHWRRVNGPRVWKEGKVSFRPTELTSYAEELGIELIAKAVGVAFPKIAKDV
jgi:hypothetical protein